MKKIFKIFAVVLLAWAGFAKTSSAAILYFGSAYQSVHQGDSFIVKWFIDTQGQSLNAINIKLKFTNNTLKVLDASSADSLLNFWLQKPAFNNSTAEISLTGGLPNGFNGADVNIFQVTFQAIAAGNASVLLDPASQALLNDGTGKSTQLNYKPLSFNILPKDFQSSMQISSLTDPDQNSWYKNHDVAIHFDPQPGQQYSYIFSSDLQVVPEDKVTTPGDVKYQNVPDGVYYFKLNSRSSSGGAWTEAGIFRVQIDSTPPQILSPVIFHDPSLDKNSDFLNFNAVDKTSGISHSDVQIGLVTQKNVQLPFQLHKPLVGGDVLITVYDNAGNFSRVKLNYPGYLSLGEILAGTTVILLLALMLVLNKFKKLKYQNVNL